MNSILAFLSQYGNLLIQATQQSLLMTSISCLLAYLGGIPLALILILTDKKGLFPSRFIHTISSFITNIGRSLPFIILLVALLPLTRLIMGTSLGVAGAIVPLVVCAIPYVGRVVEQSLNEIDASLIETAISFGASPLQIICKVYLGESLPSLIRGAALTFITLFGYTAMAGAIGAGGLGDLAIRYGYQRYNNEMMLAAIILCVLIIQIVQIIGDRLAFVCDRRK